jgi:hypothetical protein
VIGDRRAPEAPPVDSLAESVVLHHLLLNRDLIDSVDLSHDLVFPEHRWCWEAMRTVHQCSPDLDFGAFYLAWLDELERCHPGQSFALAELLQVFDVQISRARDEFKHSERDDLNRHHGFAWWLARLRRISDLRQMIRVNQEAAERAWREDLDGARRALRSVPPAEVMRIEV